MKPIDQLVTRQASAPRRVKQRCPVCDGSRLNEFFVVQALPVHVCVLEPTSQDAFAATRGDIALAQCESCSHVFNRSYEASKVRFDPDYEASLEHSAIFRDHIDSVAQRLISRYELRDKQVVEVGCGSGYFLRRLCELGTIRGVGFDPSVVTSGAQTVDDGSLELIRDLYSESHRDVACDFLCCLSVIEGIEEPLQFMRAIRQVLGDRDVSCYFEIFNGERPFIKQETFSIHYEQCNYFTLASFQELIRSAGFEIIECGECYQGDQYLYIEARTATSRQRDTECASWSAEANLVETFANEHLRKIANWKTRLADYSQANRKVVVWGSGGKGISFLNMLATSEVIEHVVDINPRRQGLFIPGSGQRIVSPEYLKQYQPDVVLLSNPLYEREIVAQLESYHLNCEVIAI